MFFSFLFSFGLTWDTFLPVTSCLEDSQILICFFLSAVLNETLLVTCNRYLITLACAERKRVELPIRIQAILLKGEKKQIFFLHKGKNKELERQKGVLVSRVPHALLSLPFCGLELISITVHWLTFSAVVPQFKGNRVSLHGMS